LVSTYVMSFFFVLFTYTAPTEIYTLSLHDALPISRGVIGELAGDHNFHRHHRDLVGNAREGKRRLAELKALLGVAQCELHRRLRDRKSTRLNSSHRTISYAVFCLKKKKLKQHLELE